jgi:hypothetical protein
MKRYLLFALLLLTPAWAFGGNTYYVSISTGSDSNTSTQATSKTTPWAHLPGMRSASGNVSAYTPIAGDTFILRGCDDWMNANFPVNWTWSGTSANPITVTVDQTWYNATNCPSGWNRPKFDAGSAVINPPECTNPNIFWQFNTSAWVNVNWIELVNYYWASPNSAGSCAGNTFMVGTSSYSASNLQWNYSYVHAWTHASGSGDLNGNAFSFGCTTCTVSYLVMDNSDGSKYSGGGMQWPTTHSIFVYTSNAIKPHVSGEYAYNNISHLGTGPGGNHPNCIETIGTIQGNGFFYIHDNWIHDMPNSPTEQCETLQVGNTGETDYVWNNVWCCNIGGGDVAQFPQNNQPGVIGLYFMNNVWEENLGNGVCANASNGTSWTNAFVMVNNFCLVPNTPNGTAQSQKMMSGSTITSPTTLQFSNNIVETITTANANGCNASETYPYAPSSSCQDTVGKGSNLTSTFWPAGYPTSDTTFACTEQTVSGVVQSVCPQRISNSRPTSGNWDSGAYEYAAAPPPPPTPAPPALPTTWVDNNEANLDKNEQDHAWAYELVLGSSSWLSGPPPTCTFSLPYAVTTTGLQSAINAIEACRTMTGVEIALDILPGLYTKASTIGITIPQSSSSLATKFLALRSTMYLHLPDGQIVCSHGLQDNLPTSIDVGLDNSDCVGDALSYQLGRSVISIPAGPFSLANGTSSNSANYNDVQYMWTAECSGANCSALATCSPLGVSSTSIPPKCTSATLAPDHWLIEDMEARPSAGNTGNGIIVAMVQQGSETSTSQLATHMHYRKDWIHGDWTSLAAGANSVSGAVLLSANYCSFVDSQISQALRPGAEGHAVGQGWGTQCKIDHNWAEGQSSGYFSGGFAGAPSIVGLVPGVDIEFRRNRFTFPYSWLGVTDATCGTHGIGTVPHTNANWGCTSSTGNSLTRKNSTELKEAIRFLESGNIFENVDNSGGQAGILNDFDVRNNSGGTYATGNNYQAVISDVTAQNNIRRNGCEGFELGSSNSILGSGGGVSFILNRALFSNELLYNVTNSNPGCVGVNSVGIYLSSGLQQWHGTLTGNGTQATFVATCSVDGGDCPAGPPSSGFQVTDVNPGDPISISGCSTTSFNASTQIVGGVTVPARVGPLAAAGTNPASLTILYPSTVNGSDLTGNCILTKGQGGPANVSIQHMTFVTDAIHAITSNNAPTGGPNFAITTNFANSIVLGGGWFNNPVGEGTPTEKFNHDFTSMTADHLVWPTRTSSNYTPYCNNTAFPCTTPIMYFPATSYCPGASANSGCVGFIGALSAGSMPLALPDYHNYALAVGSIFKSGAVNQASDGTDQGANMAAIDAAETQNLYNCGPTCSGPFPDAIAASPTLLPTGGTYTGAQTVTLSTISPNAQIYWNLTGSPACGTATLYTGFLTISGSETVYAVACGALYAASPVSSATYVIQNTVATPTFSPLGGTYTTTQSVTITSQTGATNIYTTDGSTPATSSGCTPSGTGTAATSPNTISVSSTETVKAIGCLSGSVNSAVGSAAYVIQPASGITFSITGQGVITGSGSIH